MSEKNYIDLAKKVLAIGEKREDRTGVGILSVFGEQTKYDMQLSGFPLLTSKKVYFRGVLHELIWFLKGDTNIKYLQDNNVRIWNEWADAEGNLGPVYGKQWRDWGGIDQIKQVIDQIKSNPNSRRHIVNAWNVSEIKDMALPPCHMMFQFYVRRGRYLDCQFYQRSADLFLGVPFNIASYALLTHVIAHLTGLKAGVLTHTIGDAHIYLNHIEQMKLQIERFEKDPRKFPQLNLSNLGSLEAFNESCVSLEGYDPHPPIRGLVAV